MSRFTIANLPRIDPPALSEQLLAQQQAGTKSVAVVDVRDGDHIGGHIKGSRWVPSHQLDEWMPTLLRQFHDIPTVVFHCALSKQRGPSAALRYIREREAQYGPESVAAPPGVDEPSTGTAEEHDNGSQAATKAVAQTVYVLRGGFLKWQEAYGADERLTEAYVKDLWEDY